MPTPYRDPALPVARFLLPFPGILSAPGAPVPRCPVAPAARRLGGSAARSPAARSPAVRPPDRPTGAPSPTARPSGGPTRDSGTGARSKPSGDRGRLPPTPAARAPWRASWCRLRRSGGLPPAPAPAAPVAGALAGRAAVETALRTVQFQRRLYCDSPSPAGRTGGASPSRRTGGPDLILPGLHDS